MKTIADNKTSFAHLPVYELKSQVDWKIALLELAFPERCKGFKITQSIEDKNRAFNFALNEIKTTETRLYEFIATNDFGALFGFPYEFLDEKTNQVVVGYLALYASKTLEAISRVIDEYLNLEDPSPLSTWTLRQILLDSITSLGAGLEGEQQESAIRILATMILIVEQPELDFDQQTFFEALEKQSQRITDRQEAFESGLLLSDFPPEKLDSWEDFRQALQECAFGRAKALEYFKDTVTPDKQTALIKRTDKRLLEVWGDKAKWQRNFEKIAQDRGLHSRVEVEFLLKQNEKRLEAVLASDEKPRIYAFISPPDPASVLKTQKASLMQLEYSTLPRVIALDTLEGFDRKYLKLKHRLEDAHYGLSLPKSSCESLRSLVEPILAVYILTCYPEFPEHLPSKENSAHKLKHYDSEYNLQCIEKRIGLHVVPGLLSHQQRFKRILRALKAPDDTYSETEDEQWSYIYDELDRQYALKGSTNEDYKPHSTENTSHRLDTTDKQVTPQERQKMLGLYDSGSISRQVLAQFLLNFGECVRYEDLQYLIWKKPSNNNKRPYNNAEKACSEIQKDLEPLGFLLEAHKGNNKTIGRKMIRKGTL